MNHARHDTLHVSIPLILSFLLLYLPNALAQERSLAEVIAGAIHHQNLGLAYLEESQPNKAADEFRALIDLIPDEAIGYGNLAVAHLRLKSSEEAETWVKRGLEVQPMDSQLHFILSEIYQWQGKSEEAVSEMNEAVKLDPEDLGARYKLVRHYLGLRDDTDATQQAILHLQALRDQTPTNTVVRLKLAQALLQVERIEEAKQIGAELAVLFRDVKEDALKYLNQGLHLLEEGDSKGAKKYIRIFENIQKATPRYQQGIGELVTDILGHPIEEFNQGFKSRVKAKLSPPIDVQFVDVSEEVLGTFPRRGKPIKVFLIDIYNDGGLELFVLLAPDSEYYTSFPLDENGKEDRVSGLFAAAAHGDASAFADIDKDGDQDWFILKKKEETVVEFDDGDRVNPPQFFYEVMGGGVDAELLFVDYDHDGDLDKIYITDNEIEVHRNNTDNTFTDVTYQTLLPSKPLAGIDAVFGDFDDDGDIDLFIVNSTTGCTLYDNQRQGRMKAVTDETGIPQDQQYTSVAVADYDNDGALDLFLATAVGETHQLYRNRGDGTFTRDKHFDAVMLITSGLHSRDCHFVDFDNDGFLDLWILGVRWGGSVHGHNRPVLLFRNDGTGRFTDVSDILPNSLSGGVHGAVGDYDNDGDLDLFLVDGNGRVVALRNDGGNRNNWLQVRLEAVTTGNNKVNIDGIGSKVEVKIDDLYQMRYTTEPTSHFGLGSAERADVLRVVWTNGVPQNVIKPEANQRIVEKQILKGSCPFLYVYDGERYQFVTDLLWRSPLGMVTSIGSIAPDQTADYVKIPDFMAPKDGVYSLQITEELWETAYFDLVKLMAVDRPAGTEIFVDERYTLPPYPPFKIHTVEEERQPRSAIDHHGNDVSDALKAFDYRYAIEHEPGEYQGVVSPHAIILDLGDVPDGEPITLFLTGWIFPTDTSINVSLFQNPQINPAFPYLQVRNSKGEWETVIDIIGLPAGKNKTIAIDLTGKFLSDDRRVKIATDMQIYWDAAFFSVGDDNDLPIRVTELSADRADLHYRGFSKMYRPTPHAPHLFDYEEVETAGQWRDLQGYYTRFGDVTPLLQDIDDMYVIMNAGDEMTVEFDADKLPPLQDGWERSFILYSDGWDKDGDINTLHSQTVDPLPFHGMSAYPYPDNESYPNDPEHLRHQLEYNTRRVNHDLPALE